MSADNMSFHLQKLKCSSAIMNATNIVQPACTPLILKAVLRVDSSPGVGLESSGGAEIVAAMLLIAVLIVSELEIGAGVMLGCNSSL